MGDNYPGPSGIQRCNASQIFEYKRDVGILRGPSICKIPLRRWASTNNYIPFDFSSAGIYGRSGDGDEEIRGYRFESGMKRDVTVVCNFKNAITQSLGGSGAYQPKL